MGELASTRQLQMAYARWALVTVPVIVFLGFLAGILSNSGDSNRWYQLLDKPWFQPPSWLFPVAWSVLYVLLALALAHVLNARRAPGRGRALVLFVVQMSINLAWSPVFFGLHQPRIALWIIVAMWIAAVATTFAFGRVRSIAAWLMVPYLAWISFAIVLNYTIVQMNPNAERLVVERSGTQIDIIR